MKPALTLIITFLTLLSLPLMAQDSDEYRDYLETLTPEQLINEALGLNENNVELNEQVVDLEADLEDLTNAMSGDGGGWTSNGGDFHMEKANIWFIGSEKIPFCIERSDDYPFSKRQLRRMIKSSINDWKRFFQNYGMLNKNIAANINGRSVNFPDGKYRKMNFNFSEVNCEYNEQNEVKELKGGVVFLFGKKNLVLSAYKGGGETGLGVALRKAYDHKTYESTGYVWLADFSREVEKVKHLLLHELGHVFGMKHDTVFVMDDDVAYQLRDDEKYAKNFFGKIESPAWMYRLEEGKKYIMTSNVGRRVLDRPLRLGGGPMTPIQKCRNENYMPNKVLPPEVLRLFRLKERGCHQVVLSYVRDAQDPKIKLFTFELKNLKGDSNLVLRGALGASRIRPRENPSPGVFTEYKMTSSAGSQKQWLRLLLDEKALVDLPAKGKFTRGNQPPLAIKMSNRKGLLLEIFLPRSQKWWTLNNIHNRFLQ